MKTLLLTPSMVPHEIVSWQVAVTLIYLGKVEVLEEYDEVLRGPSVSLRTPAVARLKRMGSGGRRRVGFSRTNVFWRDGFKCQYCGERKALHELSFDHVLPRSQGGRTAWENIATSCVPCNARKAGRTPEQAGMRLLRAPFRPRSLPPRPLSVDVASVPPEWAGYCVAC